MNQNPGTYCFLLITTSLLHIILCHISLMEPFLQHSLLRGRNIRLFFLKGCTRISCCPSLIAALVLLLFFVSFLYFISCTFVLPVDHDRSCLSSTVFGGSKLKSHRPPLQPCCLKALKSTISQFALQTSLEQLQCCIPQLLVAEKSPASVSIQRWQ